MVEEKKLNIYQKLVEVRKVLGKVNKDTKGYGFEYVSGAQVLGKIENKMNELGIILESHIIGGSVREVISINKQGKSVINYVVTSGMKMIWINAEKPEDRSAVDWFMVGEQTDPSQALGSGLTYSERYFILKYFNAITDDDDPDKNKGAGKTTSEEPDPFAGDHAGDNTGTKTDKKLDERPVTEKQLKFYHIRVKQAAVEADKYSDRVKRQFKVDSKKKLQRWQFDKIIEELEEKIKKIDEQDIEDGFNDKFPEGA